VVTVETALQVGITLSLKEVVVVALLSEVVHVVVLAVVTDLLNHDSDGGLKFQNDVPILLAVGLVVCRNRLLFCQGALKFGDAGSCCWLVIAK
jgi:hypothetical protein